MDNGQRKEGIFVVILNSVHLLKFHGVAHGRPNYRLEAINNFV